MTITQKEEMGRKTGVPQTAVNVGSVDRGLQRQLCGQLGSTRRRVLLFVFSGGAILLLIIATFLFTNSIPIHMTLKDATHSHNSRNYPSVNRDGTDGATPPIHNSSVLELLLRMTSSYTVEATATLLPSLRLFWPRANLAVLLDAESDADVALARSITQTLPGVTRAGLLPPNGFPGKHRSEYDFLNADLYSNATFVGFIDTDTLFTSWVTTRDIFPEFPQRPALRPGVTAVIGRPFNPWWSLVLVSTARVLQQDTILNCMSYFPIVVKAEHLRALRDHVARIHSKPFASVWAETRAAQHNGVKLNVCQYCVICNYLFRFHYDAYNWTAQLDPGAYDPLSGALNWDIILYRPSDSSRADDATLRAAVARMSTRPVARVAVHGGWFTPLGKAIEGKTDTWSRAITLAPGFCHSLAQSLSSRSSDNAIFRRTGSVPTIDARAVCEHAAPGALSAADHSYPLVMSLFDFENIGDEALKRRWTWDVPGCRAAQGRHYAGMQALGELLVFHLRLLRRCLEYSRSLM